ncbi:MAG: hypothetical protein ACRDXE_11035 [Acidimicrobiales bacterium]
MSFRIADTNEFHPLVDAHAYAMANPVIISRAHNGYRADFAYAASVAAARREPAIRSIGHYGYCVAGADAFRQGVALGGTIQANGGLRPQDFIAVDLEEGVGDQTSRFEAYLAGVHSVLGEKTAEDFGYSGASFWAAHLGAVNNVHRWIAAYGQGDPGMGNVLWQNTDRAIFAGVASPCDGSIFGGTIDTFLALIGAGTTPIPPPGPVISDAWDCCASSARPTAGYWLARGDGTVRNYGGAEFEGDTVGTWLAAPVVGIEGDPDGPGYWLAGADGGVFSYHAPFAGSAGAFHLAAPVVGMGAAPATPDGPRYWLWAADGGVFAFGAARYYGGMAGVRLAAPIVGGAATPAGDGYWMVGADGGVFAFGGARFAGSAGGTRLAAPVVGMAATLSGAGYWLAAADGGVFTFGDAGFRGSMGGKPMAKPVVGIMRSPDGAGYALIGNDGGVFTFGDFAFAGSAA